MRPPSPPRRLGQIDALRGIAALAVVLYHFVGFHAGADGIFLFFVISGFVILISIEGKANFGAFALARFARLYPLFWSAMALTIVAMLLCGEAAQLGAVRVLANLTMAPLLVRQFLAHSGSPAWFRLEDIDYSYWTLVYELVFYLFAGLVCLVWRPRRPEWACLGWLAAAALVRLSPALAQPWSVLPLVATRYVECFVVGITIFLHQRGRADRLTWVMLAGAMALSLLDAQGHSSGAFPLVLALSGVAVWLAARGALWPLLKQPLPFLGRISYALYLVHQQIGTLTDAALQARGVPPWANLALRLALVIGLASALTLLVERPAHDALLARFGRARYMPSARR